NLSDIKRAFQKLLSIAKPKNVIENESEKKPILIHPLVIPLHDFKLIKKINSFFISRTVKKVLTEHQAVNPILITASPVTDEIIGKLGESCSFYYCVDDYSSMEGAFKCILPSEKKIIEKVDGVFAVSKVLLESRKHKTETHFAPQGVNVNHFKKDENLAENVSSLKKPVVGFFGLITEWIDLELILACVKKYPEFTFVLIGKSTRDLSAFYDCKNFLYLGPIDYNLLPRYASVFDVGLIPFEVNPVTVASNPLKMLEYFSLGIPVVTTNLPETRNFSSLAYIADSNEEFVEMVGRAVQEITFEKNRARIDKAKEYSWEAITGKVFDLVQKIEEEKNRIA
ncbi:MAG: glycosyltransferase, partial [Ignavibacteria bacterium]|nr:glycosyltransferase [Ignavibacteria bacterium]